jgi:hypothetical protein
MNFEFPNFLRTSAYIVAVGSALTACGGGNNGADDTATAAAVTTTSTATSSTAAVITTDAANATVAATTTTSTDASAASASSDTSTASVAPTAPTTSAAATDTDTSASTVVAEASTAAATSDTAPGSSVVASSTAGSTNSSLPVTTHLPVPTPAPTKSTRSGVGMNLVSLDYYSSNLPTIDMMKKSGPWLTQCNPYVGTQCKNFTGKAGTWDTLEESSLNLDSGGWVRSLPAASDTTVKYRAVSAIIFSGGWQQPGKYIVRYDGSGTMTYSGAASKNASQSSAGRDVVDVVMNGSNGLTLTITATDPSNYIRNIRVYPPGGACAGDLTTYAASAAACTGATGAYVAFENFPSTTIWHPAFMAEVKRFRTLRFMDWQRTNSSPTVNWSDRSAYTGRSWNSPVGVPVEAMINLANTAQADPWLNIPTHATDDYVHQFAQQLHATLSPTLTANIEYSNEPWNYAFPASHWMYDQGVAAWPAEVANKTDPYLLQVNWYANRLLQVCNIIKTEFGADKSRVRCIANSQASNPFNTNAIMKCTVAAKTLAQPCAKSIDAVAIAPYFGSYIPTLKSRPAVATWYASADGGLSQMFAELLGSESTNLTQAKIATPLLAVSGVTGGALSQVHGWMTATKAALDTYGVPMWAYEGGQGMVAPGGNTDTALQSLINAANVDPRMGAVYTQMLADWQASGGQTFSFYSDVGVVNAFGDWGAMQNQFDTTAPKWVAIAKARDTVSCWWAGC